MLIEKVLFLANGNDKYLLFLDLIKKHFNNVTLVYSVEDIFSNISYSPQQSPLSDTSLSILFVEYNFLYNVSSYLSEKINPLNYILISFSNEKNPSLSSYKNIFESVNLISQDFDFEFFINRLDAEIGNKKRISLLQFEVKEFYEIGKSLSTQKDTLKLFEMIINSSINMTASDAGTIYLVVDKESGKWTSIKNNFFEDKELKFIISKNLSMNIHLEASTSPITMQSIFGFVVMTGKSLRIDDAYNIPSGRAYHHNHSYDMNTGYLTKSILTIPMKDHENNVIGVIQLINKKKSKYDLLDYTEKSTLSSIIPYDYSDELIMNSLSGQAAVVLENNMLYRDMQDLLQDYKEQNQQLVLLSKNVLKAHEEERRRIAREVHDGPAQSTVNLSLKLEICKKYIGLQDNEKLLTELNNLSGCIRETSKEIRTIIYDLKPSYLDDGIIKSIDNRIGIFTESTGIKVEFNSSGNDSEIEYYMVSTVYKIVQEALSNISKHSGAKSVKIDLNVGSKGILLIISDDGKGFDTSELKRNKVHHLEGGFGIEGIKERIELIRGKLSIKSSPGKGTSISISIPTQ